MCITLEKQNRRIYFAGNTYPFKDRIKQLGGHWDADRRQWWIGSGKAKEAEALANGAACESRTSAPAAPAAESADSIKIVAKAKYKGRTYYVRYVGETKRGYAARLISLDGKLDFWAKAARPHEFGQHDGSGDVAVIVKTYGRETGYGKWARTEYPTLASMQRFMRELKQDEQGKRDGTAETKVCWECGGSFTYVDAKRNGGDWSDSYCGC